MPECIPSTVIVGVQARAETCSPLLTENKVQTRLNRTAATWIAYLALIYFALVLNCLGSVTSLIRLEQKLTYTQAGLLGSSFASGLIVASLVAAVVSRKLGSWKTLALAGAGLVSGCSLICLGNDFPVILAGAFLAGTLGSLIISEVPLVLAQEHQGRSTAAFTEANALASASAIFAPAAVSLAERWHNRMAHGFGSASFTGRWRCRHFRFRSATGSFL